jgi:hypothetical protein
MLVTLHDKYFNEYPKLQRSIVNAKTDREPEAIFIASPQQRPNKVILQASWVYVSTGAEIINY